MALLPMFFPTTVMFVDDDALFLESCIGRYGRLYPTTASSSPSEALDRLKNNYQNWGSMLNRHLPQPMSRNADNSVNFLALNPAAMLEISSTPDRSSTVTVVIVDYAMPSLSGLDFCSNIRDIPIGKILLTGKATVSVAIDAFNAGLIDQYVVKQDPKISGRLTSEIDLLQNRFFRVASEQLVPRHQSSAYSFLSEKVFSEYCSRFVKIDRRIQYNVIDAPLGIIFNTTSEKSTFILVATDEDMKAQVEIATYQNAPVDLINGLRGGEILSFFPSSDLFYDPCFADSWKAYVFPATRLVGEKGVWSAACIDSPDSFYNAKSNLFSRQLP